MTGLKTKIAHFWKENKAIVIVSLLFTILFVFAQMGGDDITSMRVENGTLLSYWEKSVSMYDTWTSRVLVNFVVFVFTDNNPVFWACFMGISMYVLLWALKELCISDKKNQYDILYMICMVLMFPYKELSTAGWIATMTTYFVPIAFGMMALVPIRKIALGNRVHWWQVILYLICLIYSANNEQVMVVLLLCYIVAFFWCTIEQKKFSFPMFILLLASVASAVYTSMCPGNANRKITESIVRFPAFDHMNLIDKVELGYETAMQWLFFENILFFEIFTVTLCYLMFRKYQNAIFRILAVIPPAITVGFGPLRSILYSVFPQINGLPAGIPYWGLTNEYNRGGFGPFVEFFIMTFSLFIIVFEMFLLSNNWKQFIGPLVLLVSGIGSRVAIGLSSTIYASGARTNAVMCFCLIAVAVYMYSNCYYEERVDGQKKPAQIGKKQITIGVAFVTGYALINLVYVLYNVFA